MNSRLPECMVVDLDGTLLHPEPSDMAIPGFSGVQYMSRKTADLLGEIARFLPVIIATGRNARSARRVLNHLNGIPFRGIVLENGLLTRSRLDPEDGPDPRPSPDPSGNDPWEPVCRRLFRWRRLDDYENCLGLVFPESESTPRAVVEAALREAGLTGHVRLDQRKIFVYPAPPSKRRGVRAFRLDPWIALGDEWNDIDLLADARHPGTLASAPAEVRRTVAAGGGYCSRFTSHAGAEDLLRWAAAIARSAV